MGSFLALQDAHGVSVEDFGEAMRAAAAAGDGEIPLFKLERGEITEPEFLEILRDGSSRCSATGPSCTASARSSSRRSTRTSR